MREHSAAMRKRSSATDLAAAIQPTMFVLTIRWNLNSATQQREYTFATKAERDAFLNGIEECGSWLHYEIVE
jgi:hypothetical protein